jgi:gluconate 2-dehydrogenase alpha chain
VTVDAVIVGSGPGGSAVADVLTAAGWSVIILEKGRNHLLTEDGSLGSGFSNDELKFTRRHFLGPDPLLEPRSFRRSPADGDRLFVGEVNSVPTTVGGGGVHADGKTPRFREIDFALASELGGIDDATVADWPIGYDDLEPFYAEAERSIGVSGDASANPFAAWRSGPYPMPPGAPMYAGLITSAAAEQHGLHPYPAPTAANSVPYDGRPACNNCGFCSYYGCPIGAKGDPIGPLRRALATGRAELRPETFVTRVVVRNGRAEGVEIRLPDGTDEFVSARHVVLAAGAIETPRLALLSGLEHPMLGRNLMFHFQTFVLGHFAQRLHPHKGRSVTHVHDDAVLPVTGPDATGAGLPWFRGGLVEHAGPAHPIGEALIVPWGADHKDTMRRSDFRERLWGFIMQGEDLPQATNRVDLDPRIRDVHGLPVARITYAPHRHELVASAHHAAVMQRVLATAGADWSAVWTSPTPNGSDTTGSSSPIPISRHLMGTLRMGDDPTTSVCDRWGRWHGIENLVIADSSPFPTGAGYGPTLTLVALALRTARGLTGLVQ